MEERHQKTKFHVVSFDSYKIIISICFILLSFISNKPQRQEEEEEERTSRPGDSKVRSET